MSHRKHRVLIIGRSPSALIDAVEMLRDRGYAANATNRFDQVLDDYDMREADLVIFGGMVPEETKERLRARILGLSPHARFLPGLGGHARLLVAQVEEHFHGPVSGLEYDASTRELRVDLTESRSAVVEGLWAEFVPPDLVARHVVLADERLAPGSHVWTVPDEVPATDSFLTVRIDGRVSALSIGETPSAARRPAVARPLLDPEPVSTRLPWS